MKNVTLFYCIVLLLTSCEKEKNCNEVTLIYPINGELTTDIYPTFEWEGCGDEDEVRIVTHYQTGDYPAYVRNFLLEDTIIKGNTYTSPYLYPNEKIIWEIIAKDTIRRGYLLNHYSKKLAGKYLTTRRFRHYDDFGHLDTTEYTENYIMEATETENGLQIDMREFYDDWITYNWSLYDQSMGMESDPGPSHMNLSSLRYYPNNDSIRVNIRSYKSYYDYNGIRIE